MGWGRYERREVRKFERGKVSGGERGGLRQLDIGRTGLAGGVMGEGPAVGLALERENR